MQLKSALLAAVVATTVAADFHLVVLDHTFKNSECSDDGAPFGIPLPGDPSKRASLMERRNIDLSRRKGGEGPATCGPSVDHHERAVLLVPSNQYDGCNSFSDPAWQKFIMSRVSTDGDVDFNSLKGVPGSCGANVLDLYQTSDTTLEVYESGASTTTLYATCFPGSDQGSCDSSNVITSEEYRDVWICPSFLCS